MRESSLLCGSLAYGSGSFQRCFDRNGYEHDCDDLDQVAGQEGDDAGSKRSAEGHSGLGHKPRCAKNVEHCGCKDHGDEHDNIFACAGSLSAEAVIEKAGDECHGDVADDVSACDTECDADTACPAREYGNAYAAEQNVDQLADGSEFSTQKDAGKQHRKSGQ